MTTKKEEREALELIRNILANLDSDGYLNTAFEGCLEMAEENIENDWACSMYQKAQSMAEKFRLARNDIDNLNAQLNRMQEEHEAEVNNLINEAIRYQQEAAEVRKMTLRPDVYKTIYRQILCDADRARGSMKSAADEMADFAETPEDIAFMNAVTEYRRARAELNDSLFALSELDKICPAGC